MIICANLWTKKLSGKESRELAQASRNHGWSPSLRDKVLIKREQCQMHLNIAEREGLRRSQRGDGGDFRKKLFSAVN